MDQNSNVDLQVVKGDFPKNMDQKLKTTMVNLLKTTLGHFKITFLKYNKKYIWWLFQMLTKTLKKIKTVIM